MSNIPHIINYNLPDKINIINNNVPWVLNNNRMILLIHDMQKYFINKFTKDTFKQKLISNIASIRDLCKKNKIPIAYTAQPGDMTETERGLLKDFWGVGMTSQSQDRSIVSELTPDDNDWMIKKWRYSAFHKSSLHEKMQIENRDQILICGVYAHIGILMTALDAFSRDIETFVVADAVGDFSKRHHYMTLDYASKCCSKILSTKEVISCITI